MTQGDPSSGGFLSKVARFVRHPTVDWSELEGRPAGVDEERAALKAALQRRRRNDRVRHRELNDLRELMTRLRESSPQVQTQGGSSILTVSPSTGGASDKSRTIEQIARIEEQMSSNWQPRPPSPGSAGAGLTIPARLDGGAAVPAHLRTGRNSSTTFPMTIDLVTEDPHAGAVEWDAALSHPVIAEAAVRFANGQAGDAQKALRGLMAQEGLSAAGRAATVVMLDVLHATADLEGFEELAAEYAERFGVPVPMWPARQSAGVAADGAGPDAGDGGPTAGTQVWTCPMLLDEGAVRELERLTTDGRSPKWLDWTHLVSADASSAQALLALTQRWLGQPLDFRMRGAAVLRRRLKASTPSGRDENDRVWWQLRLALLRLMRRREEFDLAALDFCVTYGVLPPDWEEPACRFQVAEDLPDASTAEPVGRHALAEEEPIQPLSTQLAGLDVHEWPAMATTMAGMDSQAPAPDGAVWVDTAAGTARRAALEGRLSGDVAPTLAALDQRLAVHPAGEPLRIDCSALQSVDFAAAGTLLQWFMAASGRGVKVELDGVSTLIGAFFHVVGIDEAVTVRLRQY